MDELLRKTIPIYRIAVLGSKGVGKTSIVSNFTSNQFDPTYQETENDIRKYLRTYDIARNPIEPHYVMFHIEDMYISLNIKDSRSITRTWKRSPIPSRTRFTTAC
jgi:GTPase SAR1 family protein